MNTPARTVEFLGIVVAIGIGAYWLGRDRERADALVLKARMAEALQETGRLQTEIARLAAENARLAAQRTGQEPAGAQPDLTKQVPKDAEKIVVRELPSSPIPTHSTAQQRAKLHQRYDSFLVKVGLTPAQMDRFVELKLTIFDVQDDLQRAVEKNGAQGGTAGVEALRSEATGPMWNEIRQLLGTDGFNAYRDYEERSAYSPMVSGLFQASSVSLSDQQLDQITGLIIKHQQTFRAKPTDISTRTQIDWNAVATDAENILTPTQLDVIRAKALEGPSR